jgi:predicted DCC family thiol-disulfide oxidoreductase YuxK
MDEHDVNGHGRTLCGATSLSKPPWVFFGTMASHTSTILVFFDGACGLCNGFVDFLVSRDKEGALRFASLQGQTAASYTNLPAVDSVIVDDGTRLLVRSDAAIAAIAQLGGAWSAVRVLKIVPRALRDAVYDFIARNRHRWSGRRSSCRVPSEHERSWFLP